MVFFVVTEDTEYDSRVRLKDVQLTMRLHLDRVLRETSILLFLVEAFKNWLWFELNVASTLYLQMVSYAPAEVKCDCIGQHHPLPGIPLV